MASYDITTAKLTTEQEGQILDLTQKIEALKVELSKVQTERKLAYDDLFKSFNDTYTDKEQAIFAEINTCSSTLSSLRAVSITEIK